MSEQEKDTPMRVIYGGGIDKNGKRYSVSYCVPENASPEETARLIKEGKANKQIVY